ncbi:hypothetical protein [Xanthomonas arboricola]|uniref:hypothetical protein n=1 Tax=Xanthomonas arboricola TaxID=56448 RepID=UPI003EC0C8B5
MPALWRQALLDRVCAVKTRHRVVHWCIAENERSSDCCAWAPALLAISAPQAWQRGRAYSVPLVMSCASYLCAMTPALLATSAL